MFNKLLNNVNDDYNIIGCEINIIRKKIIRKCVCIPYFRHLINH